MSFFLPISVANSLSTSSLAAAAGKAALPSSLNLSVPASPALDLLGLSASNCGPASSLQSIASSVVNAFDSSGNPADGLAFTATPVQLHWIGPRVTLGDYLKQTSKTFSSLRTAYGTQLSAAFIKGSDDPQGLSKLSLGLSLPLIDLTDWRISPALMKIYSDDMTPYDTITIHDMDAPTADDTYETAARNLNSQAGLLSIFRDQAESADDAKKEKKPTKRFVVDKDTLASAQALLAEVTGLHDEFAQKSGKLSDEALTSYKNTVAHVASFNKSYGKASDGNFQKQATAEVTKLSNMSWNQPKLSLAGGGAGQSDSTKEFDSWAYGTWASYQNPLGKNFALLAYGRYFNNVYTKIGSMTSNANVTGYTTAAHLQGGSSLFGLFAEYQYTDATLSGSSKVFDHVFQVGGNVKVFDQWLEIGIGKSLANSHHFLFGLSWSTDLSPKRTVDQNGNTVKSGS